MSDTAEDEVKSDLPQDEETEKPQYRSYREETGKKAKATRKFKDGRVVWLKTATEGSFRMTVTGAEYNPGSNSWSYQLNDSIGEPHTELVPETKLTAQNPSK